MIPDTTPIFIKEAIKSNTSLSRGVVECPTCRRRERVNSAECLTGKKHWPTCHQQTMRLI